MEHDLIDILKQEFNANEGSFLLQLRPQMYWDRKAFTRLIEAMLRCCKATVHEDTLPRWLAEGFWYIPGFVRNWTTHPAWKKKTEEDPQYYEQAYRRLDDLAYWFFIGESAYIDPEKGYAPM